eukprot:CAMPEP_0170567488 /NCGR_PEP_ID=MMETSP0211-20121228/80512_1 /TAXON_ID=311385 /ORGANISM="Pseudokeronopsis sp., Strain OXSARD2" /LENGTH=213 /DNA_ID=CAMNT_0010888959 /DNA_START=1243 /DNA_END=1884 /DNA_ORIENTATION=-
MGEVFDEDGIIGSHKQMSQVQSMTHILNNVPKYPHKLGKNTLPTFPLDIRDEKTFVEESFVQKKERFQNMVEQGLYPLSYTSRLYQNTLAKIHSKYLKKQQELLAGNKFHYKFREFKPDSIVEENYMTPSFSEQKHSSVDSVDRLVDDRIQQLRQEEMEDMDEKKLYMMEKEKEIRKSLQTKTRTESFNKSIRVQRKDHIKTEKKDLKRRLTN